MKIGIKPYGTLKWFYYECSRQQYDDLHRDMMNSKVFDFSTLVDISQWAYRKGLPMEASIDDKQFKELKLLAERTVIKGGTLQSIFNKLAIDSFQSVRLDNVK